jgi:haloacid dehalogenase superfamily, subfamily IA, variant 3 with third motif having DD or ED/haloacid dehalogenase superfamily, subfamily IA, variant 1 with third motif having Dx(3-4)D or Dx(3-4)E
MSLKYTEKGRKTMIQAVIFDMDGLMFDTERVSYAFWKESAAKYGYEVTEEIYIKTIGQTVGSGKKIYMEYLGADFPFETIKNDRFKLGDVYFHTHAVPIKDGLSELLDYLKNHRFKIAVATSTSRENALPLIEKAGVKCYFDTIVCGDEITRSKPDPEIFLKAALNLGVAPEKCMVLEDSEPGIIAAARAGMKPILIPDLKEASAEIKKLAFQQFRSLRQVVQILEQR